MHRRSLVIGATILLAACGSVPLVGGFPIARDDARFAKCAGDLAPVIAAFPMKAARDYHLHLPAAGRAPELDASDAPAFVVVFEGIWPGAVSMAPTRAGATFEPRSLAPGFHDICIWVGDAANGRSNIYGDVDIRGMTP